MSGGQDSRDRQLRDSAHDEESAEGAPASSPVSSRGDGPSPWTPDLDGLLCALVLAPGTYSRNRFFRMFEAAGARRIRRRAMHVRSVLRSLRERGAPGEVLPPPGEGSPAPEAAEIEISFVVPSLGLKRTTRLSPIEAALVRYALKVGDDEGRAIDKAIVEGALARLAPAI